jgi:hypothetical protein
MRTLPSVGLVLSVLALAACEDSTGVGGIWRSPIGTLNASGNASVNLPAAAGNTNNLPSLTCYTANPSDPPGSRVWFAVGSVELPARIDPSREVLSNCILEASFEDPNRLMATLEGETPGWLYQFVVVY